MTGKEYKLPEQSLPRFTFSHYLDDIIKFKNFVERLDIRTKNTRVERYLKYLETIKDGRELKLSQIFKGINKYPFNNTLDIQLYVMREVHELMWILRGINNHVPNGIKQKLYEIVGGEDFAAMDVDSSSRNTQFELRIASYFCQEGYDVDISEKTDIIARKSRDIFFIECKRISSERLFLRRIKEAQKQLKMRLPKSTWGGNFYSLVAADVTKIAFTQNGLTLGYTSEHTKDLIQDKLIEISKKIDNDRHFNNNKKQLLLWLQIHIPAVVVHPSQLITRFSSYLIVNPSLNRRSLKSFRRLQNVLHTGESGDPREIPGDKLVLRKSIMFPKGTTIVWDEKLFLSLLKSWELDHREFDSIILTLEIEGKEHVFLYFELENLISGLDETEKLHLQNDILRARAELAAQLYVLRYPYEESKEV